MGADTKPSLSTVRERSVSASVSRASVAKTALGRMLQVTELSRRGRLFMKLGKSVRAVARRTR